MELKIPEKSGKLCYSFDLYPNESLLGKYTLLH